MNDFPYGFVLILLCFFFGAIVLAIGSHIVKQKRVQRLKDPHRDYYRNRG